MIKNTLIFLVLIFEITMTVLAIMLFWNWFIAPLGLAVITLPWAWGILITVNLFKRIPNPEDLPDTNALESSKNGFVYIMLMGLGYILQSYI